MRKKSPQHNPVSPFCFFMEHFMHFEQSQLFCFDRMFHYSLEKKKEVSDTHNVPFLSGDCWGEIAQCAYLS